MTNLWNPIGRASFWLGWPALWFYLHKTYRTRVIIAYQDKIVVVKAWLGDGQWKLPGGGCHPNEKTSVAASRELREELGLEIGAAELESLGKFHSHQHGFRYHYELFVVRLSSEPVLHVVSSENTHVQLMRPDELRQLSPRSDLATALARWSG